MGLFENKKRKVDDLFVSPVAANGSQSLSPGGPSSASRPNDHSEKVEFGVDKAIELMRRLPANNAELVVQVMKTTLESIRVKVSTIIEDAEKKEARLEDRMVTLKREIADLESEIATRRTQIDALEVDHAETRSVKERLQLAERSSMPDVLEQGAQPPPLPMVIGLK